MLPRNFGQISFEETVLILKKIIWGEKFSIQHKMTMFKPYKKWGDYCTLVGIVNERLQLKELTPAMFKCLIFVQGLTTTIDGEIRIRILLKLERNPKISLQIVAEECKRLKDLQHDTERVEDHDGSKINAIKQELDRFIIIRHVHL